MTPTQEQALKDTVRKVNWAEHLRWGTVTVQVREGKATMVKVEETVTLDTK
jgi:hypothetical protein